ncbi:phosphopentomutase [Vogesella sp. DC21W]|uniref:Phosphopentomutase n=1 Tax=Vogesella aquatica TaxID=2984206 RepID=A0ABT5IXP9_9NEIS|nr:phosphopentomutase [Vogesella aquatica]MDC7716958.1 phosphopentomutase [Vogesella aquatica]
MTNRRAIILVLDSLGIGASADADKFGDVGSNTLGSIARAAASGAANVGRSGPLQLPNLSRLGLGHACALSSGYFPEGMGPAAPVAAYGYARELSSGKDTPSGHWEIAGVPVLFDWGYFHDKQNSFPQVLLDELVAKAGLPGYLGNCHASGTEILDRLGEEHMTSGKPIFYTSADSVFQIACHEETYGLARLYELCRITREALAPYNIGRVIARPFVGSGKGQFSRTGNRKDLAVAPPAPTVLQKLAEAGGQVVSVGKIADIYAHVGITQKYKATGLDELWDTTLAALKTTPGNSIIFTNFVDFDSSYGHRRDVAGYARALEQFDARLPELLAAMGDDDIVILTADHGCDPTWPGSDHTREHIPVLCYGKQVAPGSLGERATFADIGQSVASWLGVPAMAYGTSFLG